MVDKAKVKNNRGKKRIFSCVLLLSLIAIACYVWSKSQVVNMWRVRKAVQSGKIERVIPFLTADDRYVQLAALEGFRKTRDKSAIRELIQAAKNSKFLTTRYKAVQVLGEIESVDILKGMFDIIDANDNFSLKMICIDTIANLLNQPLETTIDNEEKQRTIIKKIKMWWEMNQDYLYWNKDNRRFMINEDAKAKKIPVDPETGNIIDKK